MGKMGVSEAVLENSLRNTHLEFRNTHGESSGILNSRWVFLRLFSRGLDPNLMLTMSKDDLSVLCKQLYEKACGVFGEKFDEEYQVKKRDMEIHNLEMETSESHGTFKIPKLKKVNKFKMMGDEEDK